MGAMEEIRLLQKGNRARVRHGTDAMSLEEDGKKNKKIAYRARKTHKLRECQMKRNEHKEGCHRAEQKVAKSAECRYRYKDRIRSVAGGSTQCPMDTALLLLPRVAYSLSTLFVACHVWQRSSYHFAFNTKESLNYPIRFDWLQSGA